MARRSSPASRASVRWHLDVGRAGSQRVIRGRCVGGGGQSARWWERAGAGRVARRRRGGRAVGHGSGPPGGAHPGALGASLSARSVDAERVGLGWALHLDANW